MLRAGAAQDRCRPRRARAPGDPRNRCIAGASPVGHDDAEPVRPTVADPVGDAASVRDAAALAHRPAVAGADDATTRADHPTSGADDAAAGTDDAAAPR
jgi:hypothetical protein